MEHGVGSEQCFDAHRGHDVHRVAQDLGIGDRQDQHPEHPVGAVDEGKPLFFHQFDWRDSMTREQLGDGNVVSGRIDRFALAHQDERAVRQWCEITTAAERAELSDDGRDSRIQDCCHGLGDHWTHTGATRCEGLESQRHQRAHDLTLDRSPHACGM